MSRRAARVVFALVLVILGSALAFAIFFAPVPPHSVRWLGWVVELAVVAFGTYIALTAPPPAARVAAKEAPVVDLDARASAYRGALPPPRAARVTKASAKRITAGILAALAFTAATVPFALHLPRWIEGEVVVAAWWAIWSVVLAVVAYRGAALEDDHRPGGRVVDLDVKPKLSSIFDVASFDAEGCLVALVVVAVVGVALLGAWLVVELAAPAVFVVAYRGVVRALARARAAKTHENPMRSALVGMGWATVYTAPLAVVLALVHLIV